MNSYVGMTMVQEEQGQDIISVEHTSHIFTSLHEC